MMKKIVLISMVLALSVTSSVFAADVISTSEGQSVYAGSANTDPVIAKLSANVMADINYTTATYALATKATKGTRVYGSAADDTSIYSRTASTKVQLTATSLGANSDDTAFSATGWTEM